MSARTEIVVSLEQGSLEELLAGPFVSRLFLSREEDDTYRIHALVHPDASAEALLRVISEYPAAPVFADPAPEPPEPSPEVAANMGSWRALLDSL